MSDSPPLFSQNFSQKFEYIQPLVFLEEKKRSLFKPRAIAAENVGDTTVNLIITVISQTVSRRSLGVMIHDGTLYAQEALNIHGMISIPYAVSTRAAVRIYRGCHISHAS